MQAPYLTYDMIIDNTRYHVELELLDYGDCIKCWWEVYKDVNGEMKEIRSLSDGMPTYLLNYGEDRVKSELMKLLSQENNN